jgi:hypothetical protein
VRGTVVYVQRAEEKKKAQEQLEENKQLKEEWGQMKRKIRELEESAAKRDRQQQQQQQQQQTQQQQQQQNKHSRRMFASTPLDVPDSCVVRVRGLPFNCSDTDVRTFFVRNVVTTLM